MNHEKQDGLDRALEELYRAPTPASFQDGWQSAILREERQTMAQMEKQTPKRWNRGGHWMRWAACCAALVLAIGGIWVGGQDLGTPKTQTGAAMENSSMSRSSKNVVLSDSESMSGSAMPQAYYSSAADSAAYDMQSADGASASLTAGMAAQEPAVAQESRKLVRTADMSIRTSAFSADLEALQALVASVEGYVESIDQYGDSLQTATLNLRIPAEKLDAFLSGVDGIGRVVSRSESSTDMTVQYADNEARLATLRQKLTRLNELLAKAESVEDIIQIESAIADTQYAIDSYETTQRSIDRRVDMSQVSVSLREEDPIEPTSDMSLGQRMSAALQASVEGIGRFLRNVLVFAVMALPVLVPVAVVGVLIWLAAKRRRSRVAKNETKTGEEP